jgi:large subunit ribosomal protein L25
MSEMSLEVEKREVQGSNHNRRIRAAGVIPAVVYGGGKETTPIQVQRKAVIDLLKTTGSEHPIFLLKMAGTGQERHAMIRDMQIDPISRQVIHIDFQRIMMSEKLRIQVGIHLVGTAYGVKNDGGLLDFVHREVTIECLPKDLPAHLELDVTELRLGQHVAAGALPLPEGVVLIDEPEQVIVSLTHGRKEEEVVGGSTAEPEVIKRGKGEVG